jgi:hypothetical protein
MTATRRTRAVGRSVTVLGSGVVIAGAITLAGYLATAVAMVATGALPLMCPDSDDHVQAALPAYAIPTAVAAAFAAIVACFLWHGLRRAGFRHPGAIAIGFAAPGTLACLMSPVVRAYLEFTAGNPNALCSQQQGAPHVPSWMVVAWLGALAALSVIGVVVNVRESRMPSGAA